MVLSQVPNKIITVQKELDSLMQTARVPSLAELGQATFVELTEALQMTPYKWWKNRDIAESSEDYRVFLEMYREEIVDAIHFAASYAYRAGLENEVEIFENPFNTGWSPVAELGWKVNPLPWASRFAVEMVPAMVAQLVAQILMDGFYLTETTISQLFSYANYICPDENGKNGLLYRYLKKAVINYWRMKDPAVENTIRAKFSVAKQYILQNIESFESLKELAEGVYRAVSPSQPNVL